jgi:hypothetical protein
LWPSQATDDGDELLRAYLFVADDYPADDVEAAVDLMVKGIAPGINPGFRPKPSEFGAECRRQMNLRLDREARERAFRPKLPPPDVERTPESQARVRAMVEAVVGKLASDPDDNPQERHRRRIAKANAYWDAGDSEDHEAAA